MANYAKYRGQRFKVVQEDSKFVTLEGYGYKKRHLKDEVIFENPEEDMLVTTTEDKAEIMDMNAEIPPMPSELPDGNDLIIDPNAIVAPVDEAAANANKAVNQAVKDTVVPAVAETQNGVTKAREMPPVGIDVSVMTTAERQKENDKRIKDSVAGMRVRLREMLDELDSMGSGDVPDDHSDGDAMRQIDADNKKQVSDYENKKAENQRKTMAALDNEKKISNDVHISEGRPGENHIATVRITNPNAVKKEGVTPIVEDGSAPASAGGGVPGSNGAVNTASSTGPGVTTANVANYSEKIGLKKFSETMDMAVDRRKEKK